MPRYVAQHRYGAKRDGQQFGPWVAGTEVDLSERDAEWVNRDSPGCLAEVGAELDAAPPPAGDNEHEGDPVGDGEEGAEADVVDPVPDGTAQVVLEWVGSDPVRAERARIAELAKDLPRSTLIAALERIAAPQVDRQHRGGHNRGA